MVSEWWYSWTLCIITLSLSVSSLPPTEGECSRSASGALMRNGVGKHTSANGIIYTGEWHEDKVYTLMLCLNTYLKSLAKSKAWVAGISVQLSILVLSLVPDAWQRDFATSLWSPLWRRIQRQYVPWHRDIYFPRSLYLQGSFCKQQVQVISILQFSVLIL